MTSNQPAAPAAVHVAAKKGIRGAGGQLPHLDAIQKSFGRHDVSRVQAHVGAEAAASAQEMGAAAYATGNHVVLGAGTDLHTVAHEAAHVVQQRAGVHLKGGVGEVGDVYERNADQVADRVVRGESAEELLLPLAGGGSGPSSHPVQRILVHSAGQALSDGEVARLRAEYPTQDAEIARNHADPQEYVVRGTRSGVVMNEPVARGEWHYTMPEGHHASNGGGTTDEAARAAGMTPRVARRPMPDSLTAAIYSNSPSGGSYQGSAALSAGANLKPSGLARTHHLADSAIRIIVQYLHEHREWMTSGSNFVLQWMKALCGPGGSGAALFQQLFAAKTLNDLTAVVAGLSSNAWNVGIGDANTNSNVVGPHFDESRTQGGIPTPVASVVAQYTQGLKLSGLVPGEIIDAALSQVIEDGTGQPRTSMSMALSSSEPVGQGVYEAANLSAPQVIDLVNRAADQRVVWAIGLIEEHRGDTGAVVARLQNENARFMIGPNGEVRLRFRGG